MDFNCFYNNTVGVANVGSYVADLDFTQNYGEASSGEICEFIAAFETSAQFELFAPVCISWSDSRNADSCLDSQTKTPTIAPSVFPSTSPSFQPTFAPTDETSAPTLSPYPTISSMPSTMTSAPSDVPTTLPTLATLPTDVSGSSTLRTLISASVAVVLSLWML
jgi:hypothetical protein